MSQMLFNIGGFDESRCGHVSFRDGVQCWYGTKHLSVVALAKSDMLKLAVDFRNIWPGPLSRKMLSAFGYCLSLFERYDR